MGGVDGVVPEGVGPGGSPGAPPEGVGAGAPGAPPDDEAAGVAAPVHGSSSVALEPELDALAPDPEAVSLTFHEQPFTRWQASFDEREVHDGG